MSCEAPAKRCRTKRDLDPGGFSFLFDPMGAWNDILRAEMRLNPRESGAPFAPLGTLVTLMQSSGGGHLYSFVQHTPMIGPNSKGKPLFCKGVFSGLWYFFYGRATDCDEVLEMRATSNPRYASEEGEIGSRFRYPVMGHLTSFKRET
jgi:hypothetical protein